MENQDFVLDTKVIDRELALLEEEVPGFAVPVMRALDTGSLNMNSWNYCIMGQIAYGDVTEDYVNTPELLSHAIYNDYRSKYGAYPEYEDENHNTTNDSMTYMETVGFMHAEKLFAYLQEKLQDYLPSIND